jgi:hypothetical protein
MRKVFLFGFLAGTLFLSSCKKDWVCECTNQDGDTENFTQENQTLSEARSECKGREYDNTVLGVHTSLDCALK